MRNKGLILALAALCAPAAAQPDRAGWADARLTPGRWTYSGGAASSAQFGSGVAPLFTVRCAARGQIVLHRHGSAGGNALTIRTSNLMRTLPATARPDGTAATISANDPLLDAIAFSRGRFGVETSAAAQLVLPAWPEPARVVEDCRR